MRNGNAASATTTPPRAETARGGGPSATTIPSRAETARAGGPSAIEARGLRKSFGAQTVLEDVDLTVRQGETLAVLGRSGVGKSVLLKLLIGLQQPDAGRIQIHGQEIVGLELEALNAVRKKMGFLFQSAALYDSLTVEENVAFPLRRHTQMAERERNERVRQLLDSVGIGKSEVRKLPSEISGGMQKRVGLARALALDPDILLFDEPTAGLDPITSAEIGRLIVTMQRERQTASVVVTHDVPAARTVADRLVLLRGGQMVIEGNFEQLEHSHDKFVAEFMHEGCAG